MFRLRAAQTRVAFLAALGLTILCPQALQAQGQQGDRQHIRRGQKHEYERQVEQLEAEWIHAQLTGDVDAMERMLADDYIGITANGTVITKQQQLDRTRNRTTELTKLEASDTKVKVIGPTAIVTSRVTAEGKNESGPIQGTYRYTRVYSRTPEGKWKIVNFESTLIPPPGAGRPGRAPATAPKPKPANPGGL